MEPTERSTQEGSHLGNKTCVARFEISHTQFLDHLGTTLGPLPEFAKDPTELIRLYRAMVLTRLFDNKAIALQRTGKMGTYSSSHGQEGVSVGMGSAMQPCDVFAPVYREYGTQFMRGVAMHEILLYWGGADLEFRGSVNAPSLLVEGLTLAGL